MERLALFLRRLPGVGPKTAARLAHALYRMSEADARGIAQAIVDMRERTRLCSACGQITEEVPCRICGDPARDSSVLCVVEEPANAQAVERTRAFRGRYHVLHGALSPLDGIGPDQLAIEPLLGRLKTGEVKEVILATNPNVKGEATALYLFRLIRPLGIRVSRIATGVPLGGDLEYADEATLARSLRGRRPLDEQTG
ncbi:MAG: recombination protein RecR [Nitrospirae bacterium]|nr:recombination protein RecR [Nitrospirota bacterium]MBI3393818.1 recombination protein RecR [Nitrospirota bacterium]